MERLGLGDPQALLASTVPPYIDSEEVKMLLQMNQEEFLLQEMMKLSGATPSELLPHHRQSDHVAAVGEDEGLDGVGVFSTMVSSGTGNLSSGESESTNYGNSSESSGYHLKEMMSFGGSAAFQFQINFDQDYYSGGKASKKPRLTSPPPPAAATNIDFGSGPEREGNAMAQVKEMIYRAAALRPVSLGEEAPVPERPKRKNVRISSDPQTVAARHRRERISERLRVLQKLVPGGNKMDTASMLDEAANYLKFLKSQVSALEARGNAVRSSSSSSSFTANSSSAVAVVSTSSPINNGGGCNYPMTATSTTTTTFHQPSYFLHELVNHSSYTSQTLLQEHIM